MGELVTKYGFFSYENDTKKVSTSKVFTASIKGSTIVLYSKNARLHLKLTDITTINGTARPATLLLCYDVITDSMHLSDGNAPVNTVSPAISGTLVVGNVLSGTNGTWTSDSAITYTYQWFRGLSPIVGATSINYTIVALDMDENIRLRVTATDSDGSTNASSNTLLIPLYWISGGSDVWGTATNNVYA